MSLWDPHHWGWRMMRAVATVVLVAVVVTVAEARPPADRGNGKGGGSEKCHPRKNPCSTDVSTGPTIEIQSPTSGAEVTLPLTVKGTAAASDGVALVEVAADSGSFAGATGAETWTFEFGEASLTAGSHLLTARATDDGGNTATTAVEIHVAPVVDSTPPTVKISSPGDGATVGSAFTVRGTASDDVLLALVEVRVNSGPYALATGATDWTYDVGGLADGKHTVTARATDATGNTATHSISVTIETPVEPPPPTDGILTDEALFMPNGTKMVPVQRGRMARSGDISYLVYYPHRGSAPWLYARSSSSGAVSHMQLPLDTAGGWSNVSTTTTTDGDLWILGGPGPVWLRQYRLSGGTPPTSAALVSTRWFGDTDSRPGDVIGLANGGLMLTWHQQGSTGSQGHRFAYRTPSGSWSTRSVSFMPTRASKSVLVQHPADGRVWMLANPDALGWIGAARMTATSSGFSIDWTDAGFIDDRYGGFGPDPENPDLAAAPDPSAGTIVLAYQSRTRKTFSTSPLVIGSYPAIATIAADGGKSFVHLKVYVERVSGLGLVVRPGERWVAYRPIDEKSLAFDTLSVARYRSGSWKSWSFGKLNQPYERITYDAARVAFVTRMDDATAHRFALA